MLVTSTRANFDRATIPPTRIADYHMARGHSFDVAVAMTNGALASSVTTLALARRVGLVAPIDTQAAREIGVFNDPIEAARAYDTAAREYYGDFARTNF